MVAERKHIQVWDHPDLAPSLSTTSRLCDFEQTTPFRALGFLLSLMEINQLDLTGQSKGFIEVLAALIIDAK